MKTTVCLKNSVNDCSIGYSLNRESNHQIRMCEHYPLVNHFMGKHIYVVYILYVFPEIMYNPCTQSAISCF